MLTVTKPTACVFGKFDIFCILFYIATLCQLKRQTASLSLSPCTQLVSSVDNITQ
jgi:hypothetical protein